MLRPLFPLLGGGGGGGGCGWEYGGREEEEWAQSIVWTEYQEGGGEHAV